MADQEPGGGRRDALLALGALAVAAVAVGVLLLTSGSGQRHNRPPPAPSTTTSSPTATATSSSSVSGAPGPVPPGPGPPAQPPPAGEELGANVNRLFNDRTYGSAAIDSQLAALRFIPAARLLSTEGVTLDHRAGAMKSAGPFAKRHKPVRKNRM